MTIAILNTRQNPLKSIFEALLTFLLFLLSLVLAPIILLIIVLPIHTFRYFVFKLAPLVRPDLGKMLSTISALFASDDIYNRPLASVVVNHVVEGTLEIIRVRELILINSIKAKASDGSLIFPELTQYVAQWMGFAFWKPEKKFNIEEHVRVLNHAGRIITESQLTMYMNDLSLKPFEKQKSPWQVIVVPNLVREAMDDGQLKFSVIFHFHHCLTDGFGYLKFSSSISSSVNDSNRKSVETRRFPRNQQFSFGTIFRSIYFLLRAPYDFVGYNFIKLDPIKSNSWHLPETELKKKWTISHGTEHIPSQLVKEIKNGYSVSFNAVVLAAMAGSIRNLMLKHPTKKVPDFIRAAIPTPVIPHPGKLRNVWTSTVVKLPVGEKCPRKRLLYVDQRLEKMKRSRFHSVMFLGMKVVGGLFPFLQKLYKVKIAGAVVSNFPGPANDIMFLERKLLYCEGFLAVGPGNIGIAFGSMSYNGTIRIGATMDNGLMFTTEDVNILANNVKEQLHILKDHLQEQV